MGADMKRGDICAVKVALSGSWSGWYLATIIECDTWADKISVVHLVGETFKRDAFDEVNKIANPDNQAAALKLARKSPFVPVRYERRTELTEAILSV